MARYTRRRVLSAAAAVAGIGASSGCLDGSSGAASDGLNAQATFFVFGDVASRVAGDAATAETLVPIGQHGHGWEPGPRVREEIYDADLLVHHVEGFQPWVDDILSDTDLEREELVSVNVGRDVDLLGIDGDHHDSHENDHQDGGGHDDDHEDEHGGHDDDHKDDHDHSGELDPHFWMDPLRVQDAVTAIEAAFASADPENEDVYAENAAQYRSELEALHEQLRSVREAAETDVLLVAGHNAFQYLSARYDVQIEATSGMAPDDQPTLRTTEEAQQVIEEHDLEYVCADPLESQDAANRLVEETDAQEVLPLTAMPGRSDEWAENGWGYVEIFENVTLPTLERALDS